MSAWGIPLETLFMEALKNAFGDRAFWSAWGIPLETLFMEALVKFLWRQGLYECLGHSFGDIVYGSAREIPLETGPL